MRFLAHARVVGRPTSETGLDHEASFVSTYGIGNRTTTAVDDFERHAHARSQARWALDSYQVYQSAPLQSALRPFS